MLASTWSAYYELLQSSAREKHGFDALYRPSGSYLETLKRLKPILKIPFSELSGEDMQKVIGYEAQGYDYGWFGSIRSNGQGWHEFLHNNDLRDFLRQALPQIERAGTERGALSVAQELFEKCVSIPRVGQAAPTRLLAIYRPDLFFSVNGNSLKNLSRLLGIPQSKLKTWGGYEQALQKIWQARWYHSQPPAGIDERRAWDARVALLDAYAYESDENE